MLQSMRHMQEPTDNKIAEEICVLREKERAARKTVKRQHEVDESEDCIRERHDRLETLEELQSKKLSHLEIICDLCKAKFAQQRGKIAGASMDDRQELDNMEIGYWISTEPCSKKVDTLSRGIRNDAQIKDVDASDPYDIGGNLTIKSTLSTYEQSTPPIIALENALGLKWEVIKPSEILVEVAVEADPEPVKIQGP